MSRQGHGKLQRNAATSFMGGLPKGYVDQCKRTGHKPITADYAVWLVTVKHLQPCVVPGTFTTEHLDQLPIDERKRWLKTARRRWLAKKKRVE